MLSQGLPFIAELGPVCRDEQRQAALQSHSVLNGIDFVEYGSTAVHPHILFVHFLKPLPDPPHSDPDGAYDLTANPQWVRIDGGVRIVDIRIESVKPNGDHLEVHVNKAGDFSTYWLSLGWTYENGICNHVIANLDKQFSRAQFSFKAGCPVEFDCREVEICEPEQVQEPIIDYLAKDYSSFRQLLLDRITQLNPDWVERNPADLGMALVELLAYVGDYLSYHQDTVANEAFLDTARQRVSAKRHARLIDYNMHDGRNAWTFVHVQAGSKGTIAQGTKVFTRINAPLQNRITPPGVVIPEDDVPDEAFEADPVLLRTRVFETTFPTELYPESNTMYLHTWGDRECCLPRGTINTYLYSEDPADPHKAVRPKLNSGDYLLIEEVKGPDTGDAADADPQHRQVVEILDVDEAEDQIYTDRLIDGVPQRSGSSATLPLLYVRWRTEDALHFPACLSKAQPGADPILNISLARGNMILADHGRTVQEMEKIAEPLIEDRPFRLALNRGPLTMQCGPSESIDTSVMLPPRRRLKGEAREAKPATWLMFNFPTSVDGEPWMAVPTLLDSSSFDPHFVVDVDNSGRATLRFGDDEYGKRPTGAEGFTVTYRVGNGRAGNVGAESLAHIIQPTGAVNWPIIEALRNPLPAQDGTDPETIE